MESTPEKIAHGRAMLNTIERDIRTMGITKRSDLDPDPIEDLRRIYDRIEWQYEQGWIKDPHPRQVGDRILPRWEWWLHRFLVWAKLGRVEE